jgi:hypothetical protein
LGIGTLTGLKSLASLRISLNIMMLRYSSSRFGFNVPDSKIILALLATFLSAFSIDCFEMIR